MSRTLYNELFKKADNSYCILELAPQLREFSEIHSKAPRVSVYDVLAEYKAQGTAFNSFYIQDFERGLYVFGRPPGKVVKLNRSTCTIFRGDVEQMELGNMNTSDVRGRVLYRSGGGVAILAKTPIGTEITIHTVIHR